MDAIKNHLVRLLVRPALPEDPGLQAQEVQEDLKEEDVYKRQAERNPEADVEGYDACRKIAILSSLISGYQVDFEDIYTEGITKITKQDMMYAKAMGMTIKLLASSRREKEHLLSLIHI